MVQEDTTTYHNDDGEHDLGEKYPTFELYVPVGPFVGGLNGYLCNIGPGVIENGSTENNGVIQQAVEGVLLLQRSFHGKCNGTDAIEIITKENKTGYGIE